MAHREVRVDVDARDRQKDKVKATCVSKLKRPEFDPETNANRFGLDADENEPVHELMHAVEEHDQAFLEAERKYFESRTRGKARKRLNAITGGG